MLLEAAETSGTLSKSLTMLAQWHEFVHRINWQLISGLVYPFAILHIAAFVVGVPNLVLGKVSTPEYFFGVLHILLFLYIPTAIVILCMSLRERVPFLRLPIDFLALRIPVLGLAIYHMSICRYTKAFHMLYSGGVPITETTERATRTTGNVIVARLFKGGQTRVREGGQVWEGFSKRLPTEYLQLWQIGEESGELDKTTAKVAEIAGNRADMCFTEFGRWLPRIVYFIIMGVLAYMILKLAGQYASNINSFTPI
jgi:type II secretory pathway component PulF